MRKPVMSVAAVAALLLAWPAAAEEPSSEAPKAAQDVPEKPAARLASAEIRLPADQSKEVSEEPVKRPRAKRVTSCRCGDEHSPQ